MCRSARARRGWLPTKSAAPAVAARRSRSSSPRRGAVRTAAVAIGTTDVAAATTIAAAGRGRRIAATDMDTTTITATITVPTTITTETGRLAAAAGSREAA